KLQDRERSDVAARGGGLWNVRDTERGEGQRGADAVALHGRHARIRMADWHGAGKSSGPDEAVSGGDGAIRERTVVFAEQHARALSRATIPGDDDSRQRGSSAPNADGATRSDTLARDHRILDGRRAGVPVGGELPDVRRQDCRYSRDCEML